MFNVRHHLAKIGYAAIAKGIRFPQVKVADDFKQWSELLTLIRRLDVNLFLDVGANRGFFSKHLRMAGYQGRIVSFEPLPDDQEHIKSAAGSDPNWTVCGYALGAENGTKKFNLNACEQESVLSSFLPLKQQIGQGRQISVQIRTLDNALPELLDDIIQPRIFLKMDTQGYDREVINGAGKYLDLILGLQSEISVIPLYEHMPHYTESLVHYEQLGFFLINLFPVSRTSDGRIVEYDCLMARNP